MSSFVDYMWNQPAPWYEFWRPTSGIGGGIVMGVIIGLTFFT